MTKEKTTRQVEFEFNGATCKGYEIHQGVSNTEKRILQQQNCIGTYIHGILDNPPFINYILQPFSNKESTSPSLSIDEFKDLQYNKLADFVRKHINIQQLYHILSHP
jgi:adenosylcobyric acid synthase